MINKQTIDKVYNGSKILSVGSLFVLAPFLLYGIWDNINRYPEPVPKAFYGVEFRVFGSAKSPPTVVISANGEKIFFSDCNGLVPLICDNEEYWSKWHFAQKIDVVELRERRGVIKSILMNADLVTQANSLEIVDLLSSESRTLRNGIYGLSIIFSISLVSFVISRRLRSISF